MLPLFPQLTGGGGFIKRFSITGWGAAAQPIVSDDTERSEFDIGGSSPRSQARAQVEGVAETMAPLQPQGTGGLWSSWWTSSGGAGGDKGLDKDTSKSAKWYVQGIRGAKMADSKLVKHLISLRVHLSTAKLVWIEEFLVEAKGMDALATLLASLVGKGDKRKKFTDVESTLLLEVIRCLRVLLNTKASKF
jgi:diaphanous 1